MRSSLAIALILWIVAAAASDPPTGDGAAEDEFSWQTPFEAISASESDRSLVLLLITNDDPFHAIGRQTDATKSESHRWCAGLLERQCRELLIRRNDLRDRLVLQSIAAGLPKELTAGVDRNAPARAVVVLCDGDYRLLSFAVGVPGIDELLTLVEDAEDVATMQRMHAEKLDRMMGLIVQRSSGRLSRMWRGALQEIVVAMQGDHGGDQEIASQRSQPTDASLRLLSETFDPTYMADVRLRFGLTEATDRTRLIVLEQHIEARRPWCEAMIPFVAGSDCARTWRVLVELVWGHQPITADVDVSGLVDWYDLQIKTERIVLSLQPSMRQRYAPWPPISDEGISRGVGWQQVHALALQHPFRAIDAQQLALLIHTRELQSVDIQRPSLARYLFLEPNKKTPLVIRQSDPPGRFAGLLNRSKSNLVKD